MKRAAAVSVLLAALILAGCNNTSAVLDPSALQPVETPAASPATVPPVSAVPPPTAQAPQPPAQTAALPAGVARVHFAPVVGATATAAAPLAQRLSARAAERGIGLAQAGSTQTTHTLKGYFSAFTEGPQTTVIYVWDVLDPSGNRVHRIQGQQKATGSGGQGWDSVTAPTMESIADRTIDDLVAWLAARAG